jgi:hypothetical protein
VWKYFIRTDSVLDCEKENVEKDKISNKIIAVFFIEVDLSNYKSREKNEKE